MRRGADSETAAGFAACLYPIDEDMEVSREFRKATRKISRQYAALLAHCTSIAEAKDATYRARLAYRKLALGSRENYSKWSFLHFLPFWSPPDEGR